jgi:ATP-binding cassette, subfamily B, bacterial PglK
MKNFSQYSRSILFLLGNRKKQIPWLILAFLAASLLEVIGIGLIAPYISMIINPGSFLENNNFPFIDLLSSYGSGNKLIIVFGFVLILVFIVKTLVVILINFLIIRFSYTQEIQVRTFLMRSYQTMPYIEYTKRNSAEYIFNIQGLASQFSQSIVQSWLRLFSEGIVTFSIILLLAFTDIYSLVALILLISTLLLVFWYVFNVPLKNLGKKSNDSNRQMVKAINEGMSGFKEIKVLQKEIFFYNKVKKSSRAYSNAGIMTGVIQSMPRYLLELILIIFIILIIYISLLFNKDMSSILPILAMFGVAAMRLIPSVNQIMNSVLRLRQSQNSVEILVDDYKKLINRQEREHLSVSKSKAENLIFKELEFRRIQFSYPQSKIKVIKDVSFLIKSGDSIGIMGPSGSGKTTLIDIMLGLLIPQKGKVLINGLQISNILDEWRSKVAYLPQDVFLIDDTLRRNIGIEDSDNFIDEERLQEAIRKSQLDVFVSELPNGLDTIIGEKGVQISGGQRQRVSLARAFYYDRDILVMDESTSALDSETEKEIIDEIKFLHGKKTLIVISHSLTTLKYCDRIYKIDNGTII